jgi:AsmA protein
MSRYASIFAVVIGGLIALFVVAAIAFFLFFDPNDFREDISQAVKEATGRDLVIDGEVNLQLFPWLAVEVGHATLGNAPGFGEEPFAEFDRAELSVRVIPLLFRREVAVGAVVLDSLRLNLEVNNEGHSNWDDLAPEEDGVEGIDGVETNSQASEGQTFEVSGVDINDASIVYADRATGDIYSLNSVNMKIGRISGGSDPVPASGSLHFDMQPTGMSGDIEVETVIAFDREKGLIMLDGFALDGVTEGLANSPTRLGIKTAGVEVNIENQTVRLEPIELRALDVDINAEVQPFSYAGAIEATAAIKIAAFSPRSLMHLFDVSPPETADPSVLSSLAIEAQADIRESYASLTDVSIKLDDTTFTGGLTVPFDMTERHLLDMRADSIDLNRYMAPPEDGATGDEGESAPVEIPVDLIKPLNARGGLKIGSVLLGGLELEQVDLNLQTSDGRMRLHPMTAGLFGGNYSGDVSIDVSGSVPVLSMNESVQGVDLARLALAMFEQENISGTMSGNFKLSGRGQDMVEVQRTLDGNLSFELKDGTYEGTDIWYEMRRARAVIKKETPPEPVLPARTKFSSVTATGVVTDGVMSNDDFVADLPFMQLTGNGDVDLPAGTVDYSLRARVYKKPEVMEGATAEEIEDFTKTVIPLKVSGPLTAPKVRPDIEELLRTRVEEEVKEKLQDKLKDLFNR